MNKQLIVYYSRTGKTKQIAQELQKLSGCDIEEICELKPRRGLWGYLRSVVEAKLKIKPMIKQLNNSPLLYDFVVIGTPIWAGQMSSPMRSFLTKYHSEIEASSVFCTHGGSDPTNTLKDISSFLSKPLVSTLVIKSDDVFAISKISKRLKYFVNSWPHPVSDEEKLVKAQV